MNKVSLFLPKINELDFFFICSLNVTMICTIIIIIMKWMEWIEMQNHEIHTHEHTQLEEIILLIIRNIFKLFSFCFDFIVKFSFLFFWSILFILLIWLVNDDVDGLAFVVVVVVVYLQIYYMLMNLIILQDRTGAVFIACGGGGGGGNWSVWIFSRSFFS